MKTLNQAIYDSANPVQPLGTGKSDPDAQKDKLLADLQAISQRNGKLAWVIVAALVILFLSCLWLVLFLGDLGSAKIALGLLGVSAGASVRWLNIIWSEKSATELLLRLAVDMKGDALKQIVNVLAKRALAGTGKPKSGSDS